MNEGVDHVRLARAVGVVAGRYVAGESALPETGGSLVATPLKYLPNEIVGVGWEERLGVRVQRFNAGRVRGHERRYPRGSQTGVSHSVENAARSEGASNSCTMNLTDEPARRDLVQRGQAQPQACPGPGEGWPGSEM